MRICRINIVSCAIVTLLMTSRFGVAASYDRPTLIGRFETMDQAINKGDGYSSLTNENGALAWSESYLLLAYLDMFEATQNLKYLESFVRHADRIVANTDERRGIVDYKGRSVTGWSSNQYGSNGQRIVWLAHSGMITYPLARFAWLVGKHKINAYRSQAQTYTNVAEAALGFFDKNWVYDSASGYGYYLFEVDEPHSTNTPDPPMPVPFNQQLAAGRTYIMLYKITNNSQYHKKAEALAKHFRSHLRISNGGYSWQYWYGKGVIRSNAVEDTSHGATDVDFAILAQLNGIVFNRVDLVRFLQTYTRNIRKPGKLADKVDGTGTSNVYQDSNGRWLELAASSCVPWNDVEALLSATTSMHPQVILGVAKLVKYYHNCGRQGQ